MGMSYILGMSWFIDSLLSLVAQLIVIGVPIVFVYGLIAAVYSIIGICNEQGVLGGQPMVRNEGLNIANPDKVKDRYRIPWLGFEVRPKHLELRNEAIERSMSSQQSAVDKRNEAMGESMDSQRSAAEKNKLPTLPTLSDLHALTLNRESHRSSSTALTTSVSVLLIAGICGTMLNVHDALGEGTDMLADLEHALEPAHRAVFFTIILLILKGVYTALVTRYIAKLDAYTVEILLQRQYKKIHTIIAERYEETSKTMQKFRDSAIEHFCSDATEEITKTKNFNDACNRKHREDTETWSTFSFPVYDASRQNHVEELPSLSMGAVPPERVQAWTGLNQSVADIAQIISSSPRTKHTR